MRTRDRTKLKKQKLALGLLILTPTVLFGSIFGFAGYLFSAIPEFGMDESKMPTLAELQESPANYTELAMMAENYDMMVYASFFKCPGYEDKPKIQDMIKQKQNDIKSILHQQRPYVPVDILNLIVQYIY